MHKILRKGLLKTRLLKTALPAAALLSAIGFGAPAQATTFELGVISSSSSANVGNTGLKGWFADAYTFTVAAGSKVELSAVFQNIFGGAQASVENLWATLYKSPGGTYQQSGKGTLSDYGDGLTIKKVSMDTGLLAAGTYGLFVQGLVNGAPLTANYTGNVSFDVAGSPAPVTPVPEPETWAMLALGLAGVGWAARRRGNKGTTSAPVEPQVA